jgi:tetratricopeptide (TPR) repeat protein
MKFRYRRFIKISLIFSFVSGLLIACATPSVNTTVLMPAKQSGMLNTKRVGIESLKGDRYDFMKGKLSSFIAGIRVQGEPYFTIVDLDRKAVLKEQIFSESDYFSADTEANLGNLEAADTLFGGSYVSNFDQTRTQQNMQYCASKGENGCTRYATKTVTCYQQVSTVELSLRATNVDQGTITFTKTYSDSSENSWCENIANDNTSAFLLAVVTGPKDPSAMKEKNIKKILSDLRRDIAPYAVTYKINYMKGDETRFGGIQNAKATFSSALEFVNNQRIDRGCELFKKSASLYDRSPAIYHNIGVCSEVEGDFDRALAYYQKADRLTQSPNRIIGKSLERVSKMISGQSELQEQLR